jgi:hypothetical protein
MKATLLIVVGAASIAIAVGTLLLFTSAFFDHSDPQGESNYFCDKKAFSPVHNGSDMVTSYHVTSCDCFGGDVVTYIYLHSKNQPDRPANLILRYVGELPEISWSGDRNLEISASNVQDVSKEVVQLMDVRVHYVLSSARGRGANINKDRHGH